MLLFASNPVVWISTKKLGDFQSLCRIQVKEKAKINIPTEELLYE